MQFIKGIRNNANTYFSIHSYLYVAYSFAILYSHSFENDILDDLLKDEHNDEISSSGQPTLRNLTNSRIQSEPAINGHNASITDTMVHEQGNKCLQNNFLKDTH